MPRAAGRYRRVAIWSSRSSPSRARSRISAARWGSSGSSWAMIASVAGAREVPSAVRVTRGLMRGGQGGGGDDPVFDIEHEGLPGGDAADGALEPDPEVTSGDRRDHTGGGFAVGADLRADLLALGQLLEGDHVGGHQLPGRQQLRRPDHDLARGGIDVDHVAGASVGGGMLDAQPLALTDGESVGALVS